MLEDLRERKEDWESKKVLEFLNEREGGRMKEWKNSAETFERKTRIGRGD